MQPWWSKSRAGKEEREDADHASFPAGDLAQAVGQAQGEGEDSPLNGGYCCGQHVGPNILVPE